MYAFITFLYFSTVTHSYLIAHCVIGNTPFPRCTLHISKISKISLIPFFLCRVLNYWLRFINVIENENNLFDICMTNFKQISKIKVLPKSLYVQFYFNTVTSSEPFSERKSEKYNLSYIRKSTSWRSCAKTMDCRKKRHLYSKRIPKSQQS